MKWNYNKILKTTNGYNIKIYSVSIKVLIAHTVKKVYLKNKRSIKTLSYKKII